MKETIIKCFGDFLTWCGEKAKEWIFEPILRIIEDLTNK